jgi:hypothetical protein
MPQEMTQEAHDLRPRNVLPVELHVQSQPVSARRHGNARDGRDLVAPVAMAELRRAAHGRPGLADVRDEEKSAFVEEDEMGPTSGGVFLYGATCAASSARSLTRPAGWRGARAFANSTAARARGSIVVMGEQTTIPDNRRLLNRSNPEGRTSRKWCGERCVVASGTSLHYYSAK